MTISEKWIRKGYRYAYYPDNKGLKHAFSFRFLETNVNTIKKKLKNPLLKDRDYIILDLRTNELLK
tara:strand:+ start:219 stop:416 length:198 start_codon:yes stop_codon:yes gene_type:complete